MSLFQSQGSVILGIAYMHFFFPVLSLTFSPPNLFSPKFLTTCHKISQLNTDKFPSSAKSHYAKRNSSGGSTIFSCQVAKDYSWEKIGRKTLQFLMGFWGNCELTHNIIFCHSWRSAIWWTWIEGASNLRGPSRPNKLPGVQPARLCHLPLFRHHHFILCTFALMYMSATHQWTNEPMNQRTKEPKNQRTNKPTNQPRSLF